MNHKHSSIQAFGKAVRYPVVRMLLTGFFLLLMASGFAMNGPAGKKSVADSSIAGSDELVANTGGPYTFTVERFINNQVADGVSEDSIYITVFDALGDSVPGITVVYQIGANIATSPVTSDANGHITIELSGGSVGSEPITIRYLGSQIPGSPFSFNYIAGPPAPGNPLTQLIVIVPTSPPDGSTSDIIRAFVVDAFGNPVTGAHVIFTISGGTAAGTAVVSPSLSVFTNAGGVATIGITNIKSGTVMFTATVNGSSIITGSPATVNFVATTPSVTNPNTELIVTVPTSPPDGATQDIIEAQIVDVNNNPVPNATVVFTMTGGTASGTAVTTPLTVTTDVNGDAFLDITNTKSGTVTFSATVNGLTITFGVPAVVNFVATTPSVTNPNTELIVTVPTSPPDGSTQDIIEAQIVDVNGNPVPNATVVFTMTGGTASGTAVTTLLTVTTNAAGDAFLDITNTKSGTVTFTATVNGLPIAFGNPGYPAVVNFVATTPSVTNPNTQLIVTVPTSPPDGATQDIIEAQIVDINNNPVPNATVVFTMTGGTASGTAVTTSLTVTTNATGDAFLDITNTKSGNVTFTATVNGLTITFGSPAVVNFVATIPSVNNPNTELIVTVPTSPPDGSTQDVIEAQIVDANGNPVPNATVVFTMTGGTSSGTAVTSPLTVTTNAAGDAFLDITNTVSGTVTFTATVNGQTIIFGNPSLPATVNFVATTPDPNNPATQIVVDVPTSPDDGTTQDIIHVHLVDVNNNVVPNATVVFTITGGTAAGTAVTTSLTVTSDAFGNAILDITNLQPGTVSFTATANGISIINGSPAIVTFTATPPSVGNPATQLIVDVPVAPPDGSTATVVRAHIVDASGRAVAGANVIFTISGGTAAGTAVTTSLTVPTDLNGDAIIDITNTVAGTVTFTATVNGLPIVNGNPGIPAVVTFVNGPPSVSNPATQLNVIVTGSPADGSTPNTIQAHIVDNNGFAVPNATVVFTISGGTAAGNATVPGGVFSVPTDVNGNATLNITDITAGTVTFTATVTGLAIVNGNAGIPAPVVFVAGAPSASGGNTQLTVIVDNNVADGVSTDSVQALITDVNGNVVANTTVTFLIEVGGTAGGTAAFAEAVTVTTNANGIASIGITNSAAGTVEIGAQIGGVDITGSPAQITFVNVPDVNNPLTQLIVIVYEALADGTSTTVVKAHIVDKNGNPVSNQSVVFSIDSGSAKIITPQPVITDNNGDALISLTSTTTGFVLITATVNGQQILYGTPTYPARVYFAGINIYVPKVFTPNNDGTNDVLKPILVGIATFHYFTVYNRWGNIIFTTQDPNQGWDGTFKGVPQPVETYLWIAEGIDTQGRKIVQKGMTSLVR